ncbi:hypothetical protein [Streptomyces sp. NPDC002156]
MYALIVPASTPLVLLAVVMALSWWEDRILPSPPAEPAASATPVPPTAQHLELAHSDGALTREVPLLSHLHPRSGQEPTGDDSFDRPRG